MKKEFLMITAAIAICTSCTKVELNERTGASSDETIQLRSVHKTLNSTSSSSRAPYIGTISTTNPLEAKVLSATTSKGYAANLHTSGKMTFIGGSNISAYDASTVDATKMKFPNDNDLFLFGLYPYNGWEAPGTTAINFTFTGAEDVMAAKEVATNAPDVKAATYASLTFEHLLTKLEISIKAVNNAATGVWGNVTKIELLKANNAAPHNKVAVAFDGTTPAVFSGNSTGAPFSFYVMNNDAGTADYTEDTFADQNYVLNTTENVAAYSIIAPFVATGTATDLLFKVYTSHVPLGREVSVPLKGLDGITAFQGSTAGRAFSIIFSFGVDEDTIVGAASVTDWIFSGKTEVDID